MPQAENGIKILRRKRLLLAFFLLLFCYLHRCINRMAYDAVDGWHSCPEWNMEGSMREIDPCC